MIKSESKEGVFILFIEMALPAFTLQSVTVTVSPETEVETEVVGQKLVLGVVVPDEVDEPEVEEDELVESVPGNIVVPPYCACAVKPEVRIAIVKRLANMYKILVNLIVIKWIYMFDSYCINQLMSRLADETLFALSKQ